MDVSLQIIGPRHTVARGQEDKIIGWNARQWIMYFCVLYSFVCVFDCVILSLIVYGNGNVLRGQKYEIIGWNARHLMMMAFYSTQGIQLRPPCIRDTLEPR